MDYPTIKHTRLKNKPQVILTFPSQDLVIFTRTGATTYAKDFRNYSRVYDQPGDIHKLHGVQETISEAEVEAELERMLTRHDALLAELHLLD